MKKIIAILGLVLISALSASASVYLLPDSDQRSLKEEELKGKTKTFLRYARNEIFARKGLAFKDEDLKIYFASMRWYKKDAKVSIDSITLSTVEKANVELLNKLE